MRVRAALPLALGLTSTAAGQATVQGRVTEALTGRGLFGVRVELIDTRLGATSDPTGRYTIRGVPPGAYTLQVRAIGYRPQTRTLETAVADTLVVDFLLHAQPVPLADINVTPSRTSIGLQDLPGTTSLSKEALDAMPQLGEDLYRMIGRVPGLATYDYSAKFWVRGGPEREVLARYDGLDLIEPYHLKDFDGSLSIVDPATIDRLELSRGGFTAEYGDKLTGVLLMESLREPPRGLRYSVGLSLTSARVSGLGSFAGDRGHWLVAARRGYIDVGLKLVGNENRLSPRYYDVTARADYRLGSSHTVSLHVLHAGDRLDFTDIHDRTIDSRYGTTFVWSGWRAGLTRAVSVNTVASFGWLSWNRQGGLPGSYQVADDRSARIGALRQDWTLGGERQALKWGFEVRRVAAEYDYSRQNQPFGNFQIRESPRGVSAGAYVAARFRPFARLTLETGLRYDRHSHVDAKTWSPRFNLALDLGEGTALRGAWGRYDQAPGIHELQVQDRERDFGIAERAEQRALGVERAFPNGIVARLEAYDRRYSRLNPVWINLGNGTAVFPEAERDRRQVNRSGGRARGIEVSVLRAGSKFAWAASYALAKAEDKVEPFDPREWAYRARDQRHTIFVDASYAASAKWRLALAWQFHTGWPYTDPGGIGPFDDPPHNTDRLPAYHRLDARITRVVPLGRKLLTLFVDVFNLYDRENIRGYAAASEEDLLSQVPDKQLPFLPSIGARFEF